MAVTTQEKFHDDLVRVLARKETRNKKFATLRDALTGLKQAQKNVRGNPVIQALTQEVMVPRLDVLKLVSEIVPKLQNEFKLPDLGIILMGSHADGGGMIRQLAENDLGSDLDFAFVISPVNRAKLGLYHQTVTERVQELFDEKKTEYQLSSLRICKAEGGETRISSISSTEEAKNKLLSFHQKGFVQPHFILYFSPSIPATINQENTQHILQALHEVYLENQDTWKEICEILVISWQQHHHLKKKHFGKKFSPLEEKILDRIEEKSGEAMSTPFQQLLESTSGENT